MTQTKISVLCVARLRHKCLSLHATGPSSARAWGAHTETPRGPSPFDDPRWSGGPNRTRVAPSGNTCRRVVRHVIHGFRVVLACVLFRHAGLHAAGGRGGLRCSTRGILIMGEPRDWSSTAPVAVTCDGLRGVYACRAQGTRRPLASLAVDACSSASRVPADGAMRVGAGSAPVCINAGRSLVWMDGFRAIGGWASQHAARDVHHASSAGGDLR